ncbi:putative very long-chain specific acyl-CoA dehydrogenase mitochondrial-like [Balamuthia mandrillaris]
MEVPGFLQDPPRLGNQYLEDNVLREILQRIVPAEVLDKIEPDLQSFGDRVVHECAAHAKNVTRYPPKLVNYDGWGRRLDEIQIGEGWFRLNDVSAEEGLIAIPYERRHGEWSRVHQIAKVHMFAPYSALYSCPLAMTDGAARLCELFGAAMNPSAGQKAGILQEVFEHLTSRDKNVFWTSGQWMTERTGGSDVGNTETVATKVGLPPDAPSDMYLLHGYKYFTSATLSEVAFGLARIQDSTNNNKAVPGSKGLSLFYIKLRKDDGKLDRIKIHRLKEKLGTKTLPTAELELCGTPAHLIGRPGRGVPTIADLFNVTRIWAAVGSTSAMRKGIAVARDYAHRRRSFGKPLAEHPLHLKTLAELDVLYRGNMQFLFHVAMLQGRVEAGTASPEDKDVLRLLTPLLKLFTAKNGVKVASECLECLGGAGYMEDATDLPAGLRDQQVNTIWEGTTNVLSLDLLRVLQRYPRALNEFKNVIQQCLQSTRLLPVVRPFATQVEENIDEIFKFVDVMMNKLDEEGDIAFAESNARDLAYAMSSTFCAALLIAQAVWPGNGGTDDEGHSADVLAVKVWCKRYLHKNLSSHETPKERAVVRALALDVDRYSNHARGMGNVCPITGKMRASY